jgi:ribose transport system substrate-binding protein
MSMSSTSRRRFLIGGSAVGAGALLAACTSNENAPNTAQTKGADSGSNPNAAAGKAVTIGFSAPAADHGWIAAITNNAKAQAAAYSDVTFKQVEAGKDAAAQRAVLDTLIAEKPDVIVLLPHDGKELNAFGLKAMDAGIPVVNLDRAFPDALAYRLQIKGDNYGMAVAAGH